MGRSCDYTIAEEIINLLPISDRDRSIVYRRVFCSSTLNQLTNRYQISKQRVWQIEKKFLISGLNYIYSNPNSAIRIALNTPVKTDEFVVLDWFGDIGAEVLGVFPDTDKDFKGRCVFECFLLFVKKLYSINGYDYWKPVVQDLVYAYFSTYQRYYQASPIRANNALGHVSKDIWRQIKKFGMVHFDYVANLLLETNDITKKALKMDGYVEFSDGWYLHRNVLFDQRSMFNLSLIKMFNVAERIGINDIYNGLDRSLGWNKKWKKNKPNIELIKTLLIGYGLTIEDDIVHWQKSHNNPNALSRAEQAIIRASSNDDSMFTTMDMKLYLSKYGISESNIWNYITNKSPIIINVRKNQDTVNKYRFVGSNLNV